MSETPERISISPTYNQKLDDDYYLVDRKAFPGKGTEYIRADHVDALLAAETQFAFKAGYAVAGSDTPYSSTDEAYRDWRDPDTRTALDALLKAEREKALREAAEVCFAEKWKPKCSTDWVLARVKGHILDLIEKDQADG